VKTVIIWDWAAGRAAAAMAAVARRPRPASVQRLPFDAVEFAIVDVETTGWSPGEHRITEIGAVRMRGGQVQAEFSALVNPARPIPPTITALTGISDATVATAAPLCDVLPAFLGFTQGCVFTAHNASFDLAFLTAACADCGRAWPPGPVLDTVALARHVLAADEVANCKLGTLAEFFGAPVTPQHRALADAQATAAVLTALLGRLNQGGVRTLAQFQAAQARRRRAERWRARRRALARRCARGYPRLVPGRGAGQRYALCQSAPEEAAGDHRDRSGEGRRGADPGDRGSHRPDPAGHRGLLGDR
jgi:DNA polymerase III epsilon subunit family exonuclease